MFGTKPFTLLLFLLVVLQVKGLRMKHAGSWDAYIDNIIAQSKDSSGTPSIDKAVIIGLDGGEKWTTDSHPNSLKITAS